MLGLLAPLGLLGLATAAAEAPAKQTWLHTALVEGCVASFKPGVKPEDMMKAGFAPNDDLDLKIRKRLDRGLGGMSWFTLVGSDGAIHVGRAAMRPVCVVVQTDGSSADGIEVARSRLLAAKANRISSSPGKTLTRDVFTMSAGEVNIWISLAHTNDFQPGNQGASAVIMVEMKKR